MGKPYIKKSTAERIRKPGEVVKRIKTKQGVRFVTRRRMKK